MLTNQQKLRNRIIALYLTESQSEGLCKSSLSLFKDSMSWHRMGDSELWIKAHYYNEKELESMLTKLSKEYIQ